MLLVLMEIYDKFMKNDYDKDDLALANVIGATVFQATIPFSIGIVLTSWVLNPNILINACVVILASLMIMLDILMHKKIRLISLILAGFFYFGYLLFILVLSFSSLIDIVINAEIINIIAPNKNA